MDPSIREIIRGGENSLVEFKRQVSSLEKIAKTLVSFANSKGGTLLVGVADNGTVEGIQPEEELYMLQKAAAFYCQPEIPIEISEEVYDKTKSFLVVKVASGPDKPYAAKDKDEHWNIYIRSGAQSLLASKEVIQLLKQYTMERKSSAEKKLTPNEQRLLALLGTRRKLTLKDCAKSINVSKKRAEKILRELMLQGAIYKHDFEKAVFYTLT